MTRRMIRAIGTVGVVAGLLMTAGTAGAEELVTVRAEGTSSLTVNPLDLFSGTINLEYEHAFDRSASWFAGFDFLVYHGFWPYDSANAFAFGPEAGLRLYLFGNAPAGLWLGPYVGTALVQQNSSSGQHLVSLGVSAGGMAGFNLVVLGRCNISLGLGAGWIDYSTASSGGRIGLYGLVPRGRLAVGVVF